MYLLGKSEFGLKITLILFTGRDLDEYGRMSRNIACSQLNCMWED